ncbi:MAG: hypothetical protein FJY15_08565 [Bacteroidetes bacterium]|nr:hypothetical protein [Bacteroidota bacterium]
MGNTGSASTSDVYSIHWNPAGLAEQTDKIQVGFMHNFYFQNIANFDYLALGIQSSKNKAFGLSVLRFGVDGILKPWILSATKKLTTTDLERNTLIKTSLVSADPRIGIEVGINEDTKKFRLMIRTGVSQFKRETRSNGSYCINIQTITGVGVEIDQLKLDNGLAGFGASGIGL